MSITVKVKEVLQPVRGSGKLKKSNYQKSGSFPVIDQGNNVIAGFTDQEELLIRAPLPLIVFGDHTRALKLVKEPFVRGADGTQLIYPKPTMANSVFFYYALKNLNLSNYHYARHFKFLKEEKIDLPALDDQRKIAEVLETYDDLIENNSKRIEKLEAMARLLFNDWYSKFVLTSDETKPVTDLFDIKYGKTLPKTKFQSDGMYPIYGGGGVIGFYDKNTFNEPVCLITSRGNGSGTVWGTIEAAFITNNSFTVAAKTDTKGLSAGFIQLLMEKLPIKSALSGSAQPQLTLDSLSHINSPYIKYKDAENIDGYVASAFSLTYLLQQKNRKLAKARDLLLPRLMSGEVEV